ncbi:MAG TPA: GGDEF domain-containing protein [Armatimonadota bacterium]
MRDDLLQIIETQQITTCFQPIISLRDGSVLGYEALSRGPQFTPLESPTALFALAENCHLTWELEYLCRHLAIERFAACATEKILFLNVNPHIIQDPRFRDGMTKGRLAELSLPTNCIVLELTEKSAIENFYEFYAILEHYEAQGYRLAVDDVGAGYSGLNLICQLKPKFLKLDMNLIRNLHRDAFKQQLIKFAVDFARATEISLIAEGIEQQAELLTLLDLGVEYGQGFLLGMPEPAPAPPAADIVEQLQASYRRRLHNRLQNIATMKVGNYCRSKVPYDAKTPCHRVEKLFSDDEALMGIPIVDDGKPVGLVMREKFYTRLGQQYGYSLFQNRPISAIMDMSPLIVDFQDPLEVVAQAATQRSRPLLYDNIIVTINGQYFGVITVMDLLECITEQGIKNATYANPLTGLPGNIIIEREIDRVIHIAEHFSVLYIDLDNFKAYNDAYGFSRGDEILKVTAELLLGTFTKDRFPSPFVGHLGGDDFVVVLDTLPPGELLQEFADTFDRKILTYYDEVHRQQQGITARNRRGELESFPFMSISIAVVTSENGPFENFHALAKRSTEVKKLCKAIQGSCCVFDRRRDNDLQIPAAFSLPA